MSNYKRTTFYIGVTNSLERRVFEHKQGLIPGVTQRYRLKYLVYYEVHDSMYRAIAREKQLKNWHREWKINLIKNYQKKFILYSIKKNNFKPKKIQKCQDYN